jgi:hypothetical protein
MQGVLSFWSLLLDHVFAGPHVDSIKFSGGIVASLSLMSPRILRLRMHDEEDDAPPSSTDPSSYSRTAAASSASKDANSSSKSGDRRSKLQSKVAPGCYYEYEFYCPPRCLYILTDQFRYDYTHEILGAESKEKSSILDDRDGKVFEDIDGKSGYQRRVSLLLRDDI